MANKNENWLIKPDFLFSFGEKQVYLKNLRYKKENVLFIKKTVQVNERNILTHSEDREVKLHTNNILTDKQIHRIMSMARMQNASGILFVDVTTAVHYLIQKSEEKIKNDGRFRWMMRQAFTKAKLEKAENNV